MLAAHSDYVTCLAVPQMPEPTMLASAGLRAEVFVWDLTTGTAVLRPVSLTCFVQFWASNVVAAMAMLSPDAACMGSPSMFLGTAAGV